MSKAGQTVNPPKKPRVVPPRVVPPRVVPPEDAPRVIPPRVVPPRVSPNAPIAASSHQRLLQMQQKPQHPATPKPPATPPPQHILNGSTQSTAAGSEAEEAEPSAADQIFALALQMPEEDILRLDLGMSPLSEEDEDPESKDITDAAPATADFSHLGNNEEEEALENPDEDGTEHVMTDEWAWTEPMTDARTAT